MEYKTQRAGFTSDGVPANINVIRSMRGALGRRLALGAPYASRIHELKAEIERIEDADGADSPELPHSGTSSPACA